MTIGLLVMQLPFVTNVPLSPKKLIRSPSWDQWNCFFVVSWPFLSGVNKSRLSRKRPSTVEQRGQVCKSREMQCYHCSYYHWCGLLVSLMISFSIEDAYPAVLRNVHDNWFDDSLWSIYVCSFFLGYSSDFILVHHHYFFFFVLCFLIFNGSLLLLFFFHLTTPSPELYSILFLFPGENILS